MENNKNLVSRCGFNCEACSIFVKGKCKGCKGNTPDCAVGYNACKVRPCCIKNGYSTCAECTKFKSAKDCKDYNPFMIRFGEFISQTCRWKGIEMIKEKGENGFLDFMREKNWVTMKRRGK